MGSRLQELHVWYQFIQPLATLFLVSSVGAKLRMLRSVSERCSRSWMGEAIVRLARRAARRDMMMGLM
jgi:hypothetical protein